MTRDCGCSGQCGQPLAAVPRREFLQTLAVAAASCALASSGVRAALPGLPRRRGAGEPPLQTPRTYEREHLAAVAMPLGGLGTGTIWLEGSGRLGVWQIFNNSTEARVPDSFLAIRAQVGAGRPVARVLQTVSDAGLRPMQALTFEGGYPIARLHYRDEQLPVRVRLEATSPLLPLDAANSALPVVLLRVTVTNPGELPAAVTLLASLQNAVGCGGETGLDGVRLPAYGGNVGRVEQGAGRTVVHLGRDWTRPPDGPLTVREAHGPEVAGPPVYWLGQLGSLADLTADRVAGAVIEAASGLAEQGGGLLVGSAGAGFWQALTAIRAEQGAWDALEVFEDFEGETYGQWQVAGEGFGPGPSRGTEAGQQAVSGFLGRGLVNTFRPGDGPQGTLTSPPFKIARRHIGFLIGGGSDPQRACLNLLIGDRVVRTATGRNNERLEPASWDVGDLIGQEARLQIVDRSSDAWGHLNVDHIVFADLPPDRLYRLRGPLSDLAAALPVRFQTVEEVSSAGLQSVELTAAGRAVLGDPAGWAVSRRVAFKGLQLSGGAEVLATVRGEPVLLSLPVGRSRWIVSLAETLPDAWIEPLLRAVRGVPLAAGQRLVTAATRYGTLALACDRPAAAEAGWTAAAELTAELLTRGTLPGSASAGPTPAGETHNCALAPSFTLAPGASETVTFVIGWHFPNVERFGHRGNFYSQRYGDAGAVVSDVLDRLPELWGWTERWHQTVYQSNLPAALLDAFTSQAVIPRGPTCFWTEAGYFAGYEGCYGCCPLNCTHVWNYAQTHARLWPELDRNLRTSDLVTYLLDSGETQHRQHSRHGAFVDGHCAVIEGALRAHQTSADDSFLRQLWPQVKKAMDWLIATFDAAGEGVLTGHQWNTYDCATSGQHTFCGSQYLSALAACRQMAQTVGDTAAAGRYGELRERGSRLQDERLWHAEHEYYIQRPDARGAHDYHTGCHSDQLLGQWWAHQLDLGYLYPTDHVRAALRQILAHNFRANFHGFKQAPRRYVLDDEPGLLMCTWPHGGRPEPFIIYADEVWTGIEYAVAGLLIYEGMVAEGVRLVSAARSRYDGRRRETLNSGPGGNPYNELECGKFYARALSSGSLLTAAQGLVLDGPAGRLGFLPRWQPADHRSVFLGAECWGLFTQTITDRQTATVDIRYGRLRLRELVLAAAPTLTHVDLTVDGRPVPATLERAGERVIVRPGAEVIATETVQAVLSA
ncbi:MAG: hypothetical protein IT204_22365 [Fimbriimonadaceae bacterium]|nr:hypothetical protein [Fimbriimonadaceae bacterium]